MAVKTYLISPYATAIYLGGTRRFTDRDGVSGIPLEYHQPVKEFAAKNYLSVEILNALTETWINQQEYDETMLLKSQIPDALP